MKKFQVPSTVEKRLALISKGLSGLDGITDIYNILNAGKIAKGFWGKFVPVCLMPRPF